MAAINAWTRLKNRYRLSSKIQMNYELGFPDYLIGPCRCRLDDDGDTRTKKVSLSQKGILFSDTIPMGWFTSAVFIPWESIDALDIHETAVSPHDSEPGPDSVSCTLRLNDPAGMALDLPWSQKFGDRIRGKGLFNI